MDSDVLLRNNYIRVILSLICCVLWGSAFPCLKLGYDWMEIYTTSEQILFAGYRFLLSGFMVLFLACLAEKRFVTIEKRYIFCIGGFGLLQTTLQYIFLYIGMSNVTGTKGSVINTAFVFVSIIIAHFMIKNDKMTWKKGMGCIIGFAGVILVNIGGLDGGFAIMGEGMVLACAITYGFCAVLVKLIAHCGTSMAITSYQMIIGSFVLILIGYISGGSLSIPDIESLLLFLYLAFVGAASVGIWTALLKYNEVSKVTIFGFSIPIFGTLLSGILLGENIFTLTNVIALCCVCSGVIIVNLPQHK